MIVLSSLSILGQPGLRPRGDVNRDWTVNISDVNALIDSIFHDAKYHSFYSYDADVNGDHAINISDLNAVIGAIMGYALPPMPSYSGTLPVLYINTQGHRNIDSKEHYLDAVWWLDAMGLDGYKSIGSPEHPLGMEIKGRGNYTWNDLDKKPFRIKLNEKQPILGMKSNRHYCLLAHADDHYAKLKNAFGFELSRRIGMPYTPAQKPVEVVLNGQYIGLYFLTEKIRVENDRVNITKQNDNETDSTRITGGWLLEIDNNTDSNTIYIKERNDGQHWYDWLWITTHSPEVLSPEQRQYITQFLTQANDAIYCEDKDSTEWEKYIDIDALARFYIVGEIMDDVEYFDGSCYMYKDRGDSTKLIFGPVWDFGDSFLRMVLCPDATSFDYFLWQQPCFFYNQWIEEIYKFPHFQEVVRQQWQDFYASGFNGLNINQFIANHLESIRQAWYCDAARWTKGNDIDWEAEVFEGHLRSKIAWLNTQWGDTISSDDQQLNNTVKPCF